MRANVSHIEMLFVEALARRNKCMIWHNLCSTFTFYVVLMIKSFTLVTQEILKSEFLITLTVTYNQQKIEDH